MERDYESLPASRLIFEATSMDGSLTIAVWYDVDPRLETEEDMPGMGLLKVYNPISRRIYEQKRIALSESSITGMGPTDEEIESWISMLSDHLEK